MLRCPTSLSATIIIAGSLPLLQKLSTDLLPPYLLRPLAYAAALGESIGRWQLSEGRSKRGENIRHKVGYTMSNTNSEFR